MLPMRWNDTAFTRRVGVRYPIVQGPFGGGPSSVELAAAVSAAGGLGSYGAHALSPDDITRTVAAIRARTDQPFNVNLWVPLEGEREVRWTPESFAAATARVRRYFDELGAALPAYAERVGARYDEQVDALLEARPPVASFVFGIPSPEVMEAMRQRSIVTMGAATTVEEARRLDAAGFDLVLASGSDAGGHRPTFLRRAEDSLVGTFSLVPQVVDAVRAPVVAAGGVSDARGVVAALALGASAAQLGTAFLACDESAASEAHKQAVVGPDAERTTLTRAFSGRLARGIANRFTEEMRDAAPSLPAYPLQNWLTRELRRAAAAGGRADLLSLWAGQAAPLARRRPARELMEELVAGVEAALSGARASRP